VTELVMRWDLDAYEKLVRVFVRFIARNQVRYDNLPYERTLLGVMKNVKV
jgi:hypothetical protein